MRAAFNLASPIDGSRNGEFENGETVLIKKSAQRILIPHNPSYMNGHFRKLSESNFRKNSEYTSKIFSSPYL